jgi:hypothetical protein
MGTPRGRITVCRVEYETKDRTNWKAVVLAYTMQDAIDLLIRRVPHWDRYVSTQIVGEVDIIEDKVIEDFFVSKTEVVETIVSNDKDTLNDESQTPKCPWCNKDFKTTQTLGNHIKKYHMEE